MKFKDSGVAISSLGWNIPKDSPFGSNIGKLDKYIADAKSSGNPEVQGLAEVAEFLFTAEGWPRQ